MPITIAIVVGFAVLAVGGYTIGIIASSLDDALNWTNRSSLQDNNTRFLLGNITTGFSSVVDIEIVVIIITALSMAIFAIMAVGSRRGYM